MLSSLIVYSLSGCCICFYLVTLCDIENNVVWSYFEIGIYFKQSDEKFNLSVTNITVYKFSVGESFVSYIDIPKILYCLHNLLYLHHLLIIFLYLWYQNLVWANNHNVPVDSILAVEQWNQGEFRIRRWKCTEMSLYACVILEWTTSSLSRGNLKSPKSKSLKQQHLAPMLLWIGLDCVHPTLPIITVLSPS